MSNNAGAGDAGLAKLITSGQVSRCIMSYLGNNKELEKKYLTGEISIELCPQGTLAERMRAAGAGIPAFFTPTGVNTYVETGDIPVRLGLAPSNGGDGGKKKHAVVTLEHGTKRETREFNGKVYAMETALRGDVGILRAWKVDEAGNCIFRFVSFQWSPEVLSHA